MKIVQVCSVSKYFHKETMYETHLDKIIRQIIPNFHSCSIIMTIMILIKFKLEHIPAMIAAREAVKLKVFCIYFGRKVAKPSVTSPVKA